MRGPCLISFEPALREARRNVEAVPAEIRSTASTPKRRDFSWDHADPRRVREVAWRALESAGLDLVVSGWSRDQAGGVSIEFRLTLITDASASEETWSVWMPLDARDQISEAHAVLGVITHAETRTLVTLLRIPIRDATDADRSRATAAAVYGEGDRRDIGRRQPYPIEPGDDLPEDFGIAPSTRRARAEAEPPGGWPETDDAPDGCPDVADATFAADGQAAAPLTDAEVMRRWGVLVAIAPSLTWPGFVAGLRRGWTLEDAAAEIDRLHELHREQAERAAAAVAEAEA